MFINSRNPRAPFAKGILMPLIALSLVGIIALSAGEARANTLNFNGLTHTSTGVATLAPAGPNLAVSNIGSSGLDGVSVDIDPSALYKMDWLPLDGLNATPLNVNLLSIGIRGRAGGPVQALGISTIQRTPAGTSYEIAADYTAAGSATYGIGLYLSGSIVFSQSGMTLPLEVTGDGSDLPRGATAGLPGSIGGLDPGFIWRFSGGLPVTVPGGPTILSDEVRLLADNPTNPFTSLSEFTLLARDIPQGQIVITGSTSRQIPEPGAMLLLATGAAAILRRKKIVRS